MQGLRCHFISVSGKSPTKLEVKSRHDLSCLLGRKASNQTNKQNFCATITLKALYFTIPNIYYIVQLDKPVVFLSFFFFFQKDKFKLLQLTVTNHFKFGNKAFLFISKPV